MPMPLAVSVMAGGAVLYFSGMIMEDSSAFLFVNFLVGAAAIAVAVNVSIPRAVSPVVFLGRESLPIYLWHYISILAARHFASGLGFVVLASLGIAVVVLAVYVVDRIRSPLLHGLVLGRWAPSKSAAPQAHEDTSAQTRVPASQ
jgi:peptidoglycan/LPS O-acetylase OafA/YrhL